MKKYLHLTITRSNGETYTNPLTLSEVHLISQIVKENKSVLVSLEVTTQSNYKILFGK